jgi:hypothetical protein
MPLHRQLRVDVHAKVADDRYGLDRTPTDVFCPVALGYFAVLKLCSSAEPQHFRLACVEVETLRRAPTANVFNARLYAGHNRMSLGRLTMLETLHIIRVQVEAYSRCCSKQAETSSAHSVNRFGPSTDP